MIHDQKGVPSYKACPSHIRVQILSDLRKLATEFRIQGGLLFLQQYIE